MHVIRASRDARGLKAAGAVSADSSSGGGVSRDRGSSASLQPRPPGRRPVEREGEPGCLQVAAVYAALRPRLVRLLRSRSEEMQKHCAGRFRAASERASAI